MNESVLGKIEDSDDVLARARLYRADLQCIERQMEKVLHLQSAIKKLDGTSNEVASKVIILKNDLRIDLDLIAEIQLILIRELKKEAENLDKMVPVTH